VSQTLLRKCHMGSVTKGGRSVTHFIFYELVQTFAQNTWHCQFLIQLRTRIVEKEPNQFTHAFLYHPTRQFLQKIHIAFWIQYLLKFGFSEKATKFEKIFVLLLTRASCSVRTTAYLSKSWQKNFKTNVVKSYYTNFSVLSVGTSS
jgi:hypothetical protein